ncbi:hypothetical protein KVT40_002252 [Elsinoe batatas]|uniref:Bacterial alpha-L-rhamnosidase N-terminal domain-containing protein n=1 Tax=Elsinoe batatas TaxID=2601811 RepID=A0A8K0L9L0_9PEZI|nr:hypothetical protein KVT40_002252 [Elsinoe batatas]
MLRSLLLSVSTLTALASCTGVNVVRLAVDGRTDNPLGLDDVSPVLTWQIVQTGDCSDAICPGDKQTAYGVQAAKSIERLGSGSLCWTTGRVNSDVQQVRFTGSLASREKIAWRVRVTDALNNTSAWSETSTWTVGLLEQSDWGEARWIDYPDRTENLPLPIFARQFNVPEGKSISEARFYLAGIGLHHATVNGQEVTDEVLAPGYSNWQLSTEYRTYDITEALSSGTNAIGVSLGNGFAYNRRSMRNPAVGRNSPYAWWQSQLKGNSTLGADVQAGATTDITNTTGYTLGATINIDTGNGGDNLESRVITAVGNSTLGNSSISFTPALSLQHSAGAKVTGSGNNIAATDPSAGAAVLPRFIARLEVVYIDNTTQAIVSDRSWRTTLGPLITDAFYAGSDFDARAEPAGWDTPSADLNATGWVAAGFAPPPNLATKLVARIAEVIKVQERFSPISVTNPAPGTRGGILLEVIFEIRVEMGIVRRSCIALQTSNESLWM